MIGGAHVQAGRVTGWAELFNQPLRIAYVVWVHVSDHHAYQGCGG